MRNKTVFARPALYQPSRSSVKTITGQNHHRSKPSPVKTITGQNHHEHPYCSGTMQWV
jgi:hypothetical protein